MGILKGSVSLAFTVALLVSWGLSVQPAVAGAPQWVAPLSVPSVHLPPKGQHGFPFMTPAMDLGSVGYVEKEFLVSGTARAFVPVSDQPLRPDGRWNVMPNPGVTAPYTTRILVRRPEDPEAFNGTVVVEWFNESAGFDTPSDWLYMHDEIVREGYAYVGVTAQFVGVQALQAWESGRGARYVSLFHPGESFAYDIFAQVGAVVTHARNGDPRPLGDLTGKIHTVLAAGFSQSANWLTTYVNAIHRLYPVYAGYLIHDAGFGGPVSLDVASFYGDPIPAGVPPTPFIDTPYPMRLRNDQDVPALILLSEFGLSDCCQGAGRTFHRQGDAAHFRVWEIAGATHLESNFMREFAADANKTYPGFALQPCRGPRVMPGIVHGRAARAALDSLNGWANDRQLPRSAPRLSLNVPNPPDLFDVPVVFNRDPATNLAIGGIRLPAVSVPTGTLNGNRSDLDAKTLGPGPQCGLVGSFDPWNHDGDAWDGRPGFDPSPAPEPDLQLLYATHEDYVQRVAEATAQSIRDGFVRPADGAKIVRQAAHAQVP